MFGYGGMGMNPMMGGGMPQNYNPETTYIPDTAEVVKISGLALLKMMSHCKKGIPFEVMGVMLGEFIDEYTVEVVDVFAMP